MTSWALLLLASALLATPGLTFSGLTPEDHDLDMADRCLDKEFFQMLAQETPQGDRLKLKCRACKMLINLLRKALRDNVTEEGIKRVASLVCRRAFVPKSVCMNIITKYVSKITEGIVNGKSSQEICVKLRMCKPEIGL